MNSSDTMKREVADRMGDAFAPVLDGGDPIEVAAQVRARLKASRRPPADNPVGNVQNRTIPGPAGDIPVRIYHPLSGQGSGQGLPVLLYFHGGGFVLCDLDSHDSCCRRCANGVGAVVISVDYRLAPENPYPAAVEDAWAATEWVAANARELGGDPDRFVIAGDSAGGNLAAVVAMTARDRGGPSIAFQVLIYPVVDQRRKASLSSPHTKSGVLTAAHMQWFTEQYLGSGDRAEVQASPILGDMTGLPDAHVLTGALDPLCEEGEEYARLLAAGGAQVSVRRYDRGFHGFFNLADHLPAAAEANDDVCAVIRTALHAHPSPELPTSSKGIPMELRNGRALVTGASRGLGKSIAEVLSQRGVDVALVARDGESLQVLAKEIDGKAYPTDLSDPAAVEALLPRVEADGGPVDILINNAGIDCVGLFPSASAAQVQALLQVNLAAPLELCRQAMPGMMKRNRGHIVNVSSYGAISQGPGVTLYATSKAGLSHFTAGIRSELRGSKVGTTLVQIGEVKTDMIDHIREFTPARKTIERFERLRMLPAEALEPVEVATAIVDAVEHNRRHVILPRRIAPMAKFTEFPRRMSEILLTGIDQNEK